MTYHDLSTMREDQRIAVMGQYAMTHDVTVMVTTDAKPVDKLDRYITKMVERFPLLEIVERGDGPTTGVVFFTMRKKAH